MSFLLGAVIGNEPLRRDMIDLSLAFFPPFISFCRPPIVVNLLCIYIEKKLRKFQII